MCLLSMLVPCAAELSATIHAISAQGDVLDVPAMAAVFTGGGAGMSTSGAMATVTPDDGCGPLGALYGAVLVVRMHVVSNCSAFNVGLRAAAARAVAVVVAGPGDMVRLSPLPAEESLAPPSIPIVSTSAASGALLVALAAPVSVQVHLAAATSDTSVEPLSYVMLLTLLMIGLATGSVVLLCVWHAVILCRARREHARRVRARAAAASVEQDLRAAAFATVLCKLAPHPYAPAPCAGASASEICAVCLTNYADGDTVCTLPCGHDFHHACVVPWLRLHTTCPLCKFDVTAVADVADAEETVV